MYYLCEECYKPITVQYYIADCVNWVPRLTLLDLGTCSRNGSRSYVGGLLYWKTFHTEVSLSKHLSVMHYNIPSLFYLIYFKIFKIFIYLFGCTGS